MLGRSLSNSSVSDDAKVRQRVASGRTTMPPTSRKSLTNSMPPPQAVKTGSGTRAEGLQDHEVGPRTKLIFRRVKSRYGHIPVPTRLRAHDPKLLELCEEMSRNTVAPGTVPANLKELAQLKVATIVGCEF